MATSRNSPQRGLFLYALKNNMNIEHCTIAPAKSFVIVTHYRLAIFVL